MNKRIKNLISDFFSTEQRIDTSKTDAPLSLAKALTNNLIKLDFNFDEPIITLCVGTDRSTGDSLGPLVGTFLTPKLPPNYLVFGTLDQPVHAKNIKQFIDKIEKHYPRSPVIAIDACLGRLESVGFITVGCGSLEPGAGVNKDLPPVGDIYIKGVVNVGGFMEYLVLQNTRLSLVMKMAKVISEGILKSFSMHNFSQQNLTPQRL
ncbi:MAG TPA: spore protease YyaC [Clostridia bacterium]|jgi:putative sporulation protein YyaC|nr:spore protease YyaC [Clostridia bacterium]